MMNRCDTFKTKCKSRRGIASGGEDNFCNHKLEKLSFWTRSLDVILKKEYVKIYYGNRKNSHIFKFSPKGKEFRSGILAGLKRMKSRTSETFWPKTSKGQGVQDAPLLSYKRLKNEISTGGNRKFFSSLQKFLLLRVIFRNFFHISC